VKDLSSPSLSWASQRKTLVDLGAALRVIVAVIFGASAAEGLAQRAVTRRERMGSPCVHACPPTLREKQREGWDALTLWLC